MRSGPSHSSTYLNIPHPMDNNPTFAPLDRSALMVAALTPVLEQWVNDTVAFHQSHLRLAAAQEPGRPGLSAEECRGQATGFKGTVLRSVAAGAFHVGVPFDAKTQAPGGALSALPLESLQRLSELQRLGLLAGLRLVWPPALSRLDPWWGAPLPADGPDAVGHDPSSAEPSESTDDDSDGLPSTPATPRGRRRPGDKCNIS